MDRAPRYLEQGKRASQQMAPSSALRSSREGSPAALAADAAEENERPRGANPELDSKLAAALSRVIERGKRLDTPHDVNVLVDIDGEEVKALNAELPHTQADDITPVVGGLVVGTGACDPIEKAGDAVARNARRRFGRISAAKSPAAIAQTAWLGGCKPANNSH